MSELKILILADDLTGALEVGAKFADRGLPAPVISKSGFDLSHHEGATPVLAVDTETRHASPTAAAAVVHKLACQARDNDVRLIYKKTDSTLRGNIASELQALILAFPGQPVVYVPAYPRLGRTVRDGVLLVDGMPVDRTTFAIDPLDPVRESYIPALFGTTDGPVATRIRSVQEIGAGSSFSVYLLDGERDDDVRAAAREFVGSGWLKLAAGPSGFADYLAEAVSLPRSSRARWPTVRSCLVVNGSMHEASREQMRWAGERGWGSCRPNALPPVATSPGWCLFDAEGPGDMGGPQSAARIGGAVRDLLRRIDFDAVTVFGGDTAFQTVKAFGSPILHPLGEVLPGVPVSRIGATSFQRGIVMRRRDLYFITKAGGYGPIDLLNSLKVALERR